MGSLASGYPALMALVLSLHAGNVRQNHRVTQQYPTTLTTAPAQDSSALPGLILIPFWGSDRFATYMTRSSNVMATGCRRKNLNEWYTIRLWDKKSPAKWIVADKKKAM